MATTNSRPIPHLEEVVKSYTLNAASNAWRETCADSLSLRNMRI
ncbi:hypothetical protein ALQ92_200295 [Pseudomonas syringae pv. pisi]|uniref:Uncharacterized protein n=1 Tax=Pseudomonas savastanoi pv. phaseolicola TaxID=319 RepID=A0A7Z6URI4_PSESH|nr:hypothetical protein ALQ92_200295 [Pseudomonas syringae pv. pisi]RMU83252.1 hypothetical protein ALP21_200250 [Pseudomonas savastanoi pv. phaseolicola]